MQKLNYERLLANYESRTQGKFAVAAALHDLQELNKSIAKVIVSFSVESHDREKNFMAVANLFDGMARPIEGSFRVIPSSRAFAAVGYVTKNTEVRECSTAGLQKYRVMAGNLLMDENDSSLWELKSVNGSKYLTRHSEESLGELVALASLKHHGELVKVGAISDMVMASVQSGEFVVYVSPKKHEVRCGYAVSAGDESMEVLDMEDEQVEEVPNDFLIESAYLKNQEIAANLNPPLQGNKSALIAYYKEMYSFSPEYFAKIKAIIEDNAAL